MLPDREGFLYPTVTDACIQCGHCAHICPVLKQREPRPEPAVFAAWNPNPAVRQTSTAGGVFPLLAEYILDEGGVVFGAALDQELRVRHIAVKDKAELPRLQGVDGSHRVHLSEADYVVEGEHEPLPLRSYREPSETDLQIAKLVVEEIPDGAVLSLGVGGVPFTVAKLLAQSDRKDLGCHTGTISDAFLELWKAGKLTNARKEVDQGLSTWNLAMGSQELYDWLDQEPQLFRPGDVDYVHSVERISRMSNVISINGGVEVDLMGQENGESAGTRQLSGIGGQMDFLEGAYRSKGGKGFVCLNATHKKKDGTLKSNIVPCIAGGSTVSAPRTMIQYVATEYGVAKLSGKTLRERAEALAAIAHPDFREELLRYARENFY